MNARASGPRSHSSQPASSVPWAPGITGGDYDLQGFVVDEVPCEVPIFSPIYDPLCPTLVPPPRPANVPLLCFDPPENWRRRQITIPAQYITTWGDLVPVVQVHARWRFVAR